MLAQEAETNSFSQSLSKRTLSLRMCLRIFLLCSFQLVCAALFLGTCSFRMSLPIESLQADQLVAAYSSSFKQPSLQQEELGSASSRRSFQQHSFQQESLLQDELAATQLQSPTRASQLSSFEKIEPLESFIYQLDLENSLSLPWFSLLRCSNSSFELRALPCAALLYKTRINIQLQNKSGSELSAYKGSILALLWFQGELSTKLCRQELSAHLCNAQL